MVRPIRLAFAAVDNRLLQAARTLGATPLDAFWSVVASAGRGRAYSAGRSCPGRAAWASSGILIMIAGNIPGETRTVPLMVYSLLESPDGLARSRQLVIASIVIAAVALAAGEWLGCRGQRRLRGSGG